MRVLIIEDSVRLRESLAIGLQRSGFAVDSTGDGCEGFSLARNNPFDVIVLDWMLPGMDGLELLKALRAQGCGHHVILLSARDTVEDRITGLRAGADDYLVKPFSFDELEARIRALVRRRFDEKAPELCCGELVIDTGSRTVSSRGSTVPLTPREYALIELLAYRAGRIVTRVEIEDHIYGGHELPASNAVDATVRRLREKLSAVGLPALIHTRRGQGYLLEVAAP